MPIQVKSYQRKTKSGIKVVNSFIRKGDKKKEKQKLIKAGSIGAVAGGLLVGGILKRKQLGKLISTAGQKLKSKFINIAKKESNVVKGIGEQVSKNKPLQDIPISTKSNNLVNVKSGNQSLKKGLVKPVKKAKLINTEKKFIPEEIPDPWTTSNNTKSKIINVNKLDNVSQKALPPAKRNEVSNELASKNIERYPKIDDPWDDVTVIKNKQNNNLINTKKEPQKLLSPGKVQEKIKTPRKRTVKKTKEKTEKIVQVKKEKPFIEINSTQQGRDRVHGKLRSVNRDAYRAVKEDDYKLPYQWDKKLVTDKNLLDIAKSPDISDRQRANEIFKDLNKKRNLARKALKNAKNKIEKTSSKIDKTKTKLNLPEKEKQIKNLINTNFDKIKKEKKKLLYDLETSQKQKLSQKAGRVLAKTKKVVEDVKDKAEGSTVKKVNARRRQILTLGLPDAMKKASETAKGVLDSQTGKEVKQGLIDLTKQVQSKSDEASKLIETAKKESEKLINTGKSKVDEVQEKVEEGLKQVSESQERLKKTVKKKLEEKGIINDSVKPSPFASKIGENLINTGKKEADKIGKIEALSQIDPRLGRGFAIIDDVKGRIKQVERYADELEKNGERISSRRQLFIKTGKKIVEESSKKPKDAYYVGKGTVSKGRTLVRSKSSQIQRAANTQGNLYSRAGDLQVYQRTGRAGYRPARGLLEKLAQTSDRFARWKSGDTNAFK